MKERHEGTREDVGKMGQRLQDNECDAVSAGLLVMYSVCDQHHINKLNGGLVGEGIHLSGAGMQCSLSLSSLLSFLLRLLSFLVFRVAHHRSRSFFLSFSPYF